MRQDREMPQMGAQNTQGNELDFFRVFQSRWIPLAPQTSPEAFQGIPGSGSRENIGNGLEVIVI